MPSRVLPFMRVFPRRVPSDTVGVRAQTADWCVSREWERALLGNQAPSWLSLGSTSTAEQVKTGRNREVWFASVEGRLVVAKVVKSATFRDWLKAKLIAHPVEREWATARAAQAGGVPAVVAVACGVTSGHRPTGVLITERVPDAAPLAEHGRRGASPADRRAVIEAVAQLFAVAHERGFFHRDAHPDNVLVSPSPDGAFLAVFADLLGACVLGQAVSIHASGASLAQLYQDGQRFSSRSEQVRFLRHYLRGRFGPRGTTRGAMHLWLDRLREASARHAERLARQRDRRLGCTGSYFARLDLDDGWRATVATTLERRHVFPEPGVPDRDIGTWVSILGDALAGPKQHDPVEVGVRLDLAEAASPREQLRWTLVGSPARRAFEDCHRRRHRDDPAELVLGYAEKRRFGRVLQAAVIRPVVSGTGGS